MTTTIPTPTTTTTRDQTTSCRLDVTGMDCADCARTIEASLSDLTGVKSARVNAILGIADVVYDPEDVDRAALVGRVKALGYDVQAPASAAGPWTFDITGMDCGDCARTIEAGVRRLPGAADAVVNFGAATLTIHPSDDQLNRVTVVETVAQAGYHAQPRDESRPSESPRPWWRQRRVIDSAIAAVLWLIGFGLDRTDVSETLVVVAYLASMVIAGYPVARAAWFALRARRADMNLLMTIAAVGAIAIGEWGEGATVLILFAIGLTLQSLTVERTRRAIQALVRLAPSEATVRRNGAEVCMPVAALAIGDTVIVRPGERLPIDGEVITGQSAVDQSPITGESIPVAVEPGGSVFAGSINGDGLLEIRATTKASDTTLSRIIHLVEEAQASRAPAQALVDRFAAIYTPVVVAIAVLLATVVPLLAGDFESWFSRALILLVVACPCALVISTPVALVAAIGSASRRGVLFKGGAAIEALAAVRAVAFDKTGTLTVGRPALTDIIPLGNRTADHVLAHAAAVEALTSHPIARGIVRAARERGLALIPATDAEMIPGRGARANINGETVIVGNRRLFKALSAEVIQDLDRLEADGKTTVLVGTDRDIFGVLGVADPIRPVTVSALDALNALGLTTVMLTGDNRTIARRIAAQAGVADIRAELLPQDKATAIVELQQSAPVAMVGDGVNDAPALAAANVGIAMGVAGSDVAIETADVALMRDDLSELSIAIRLARQTMSIIRQNIAASLLVKLAFILLTFLGVTNLWLAVLADTGMSLLVTFNSLRLAGVMFPSTPIAATASPSHGASHQHALPATVD